MLSASSTFDPDAVIAPVDDHVFGAFVEHVGRCVCRASTNPTTRGRTRRPSGRTCSTACARWRDGGPLPGREFRLGSSVGGRYRATRRATTGQGRRPWHRAEPCARELTVTAGYVQDQFLRSQTEQSQLGGLVQFEVEPIALTHVVVPEVGVGVPDLADFRTVSHPERLGCERRLDTAYDPSVVIILARLSGVPSRPSTSRRRLPESRVGLVVRTGLIVVRLRDLDERNESSRRVEGAVEAERARREQRRAIR